MTNDTDTAQDESQVKQAAAYKYEIRIPGNDWVERATVQHPNDIGYDKAENVDLRNVRPLKEVDC